MKPKKIKLNKYKDSRGYLLELLPKKFRKKFKYSIITKSKKKVIRGIHYDQKMKEEKLVYVIKGKILDVCVDISKFDDIKKKIFYNKLNEGEAIFIPKKFAHGYACFGKENILIYFLSKVYNHKTNKGIKWSDKSLKIKWSIKNPIISKKDKKLPTLPSN